MKKNLEGYEIKFWKDWLNADLLERYNLVEMSKTFHQFVTDGRKPSFYQLVESF